MKNLFAVSLTLAVSAASHSPAAQIPLDSAPQPLTIDAIPLIGFGTWNLKGDNVSESVAWAIETGYRHIDCADAYGNEDLVGVGIAMGLAKTGLKREDLWITSKLWNNKHGSDAPELALNTTLQRLGVGYLDLYHMHWPVAQDASGSTSLEYLDTWAAMELLLEQGRTRYIGVCNFAPKQIKDLLKHAAHPPSVHQMELHPYLPQTEWIEYHERHGIHVTAYSPLAGTNPTYQPGDLTPLLSNPLLHKIAEKRSCTPAQVALQWGISRGTSIIPKSQHKGRITENFHAVECALKAKDLKAISHVLGSEHHRYINPSKSWKVELYHGLEDSKGNHKLHS